MLFCININNSPIGVTLREGYGSNLLDRHLLPSHQRKGIGTNLLKQVMSKADEAKLPIRLEYLKWNPVGSLYRRHGFKVVSENEIHYFLERKPNVL
jgi:ribosomal protein S18 acetylase RimI-like enzyme